MYDALKRAFHWPHTAVDVDFVVRYSPSCARYGTKNYYRRYMQLFTESRLLDSVAIDIVEPFPKTAQKYRNHLIITDRYTILTRAVPTSKTTGKHTANHFMKHCLTPYGIPTYFFTDSGMQVVKHFFVAVCALLGVIKTTAYCLQTNGQAERFRKVIFTHSHHYVVENKKN